MEKEWTDRKTAGEGDNKLKNPTRKKRREIEKVKHMNRKTERRGEETQKG